MGHLNSFSASGGGNFPKIFQKFKCSGGCPGAMFKLRFDWYTITSNVPRINQYGLQIIRYYEHTKYNYKL